MGEIESSRKKEKTAKLLRKATRHISHAKLILQKLPKPLSLEFIRDIEILDKIEIGIKVKVGILDGEIDLKKRLQYMSETS